MGVHGHSLSPYAQRGEGVKQMHTPWVQGEGRLFTFNLLYLHMKVASSILCCLWCRLHNCFTKHLLQLFSYLSSVLPSFCLWNYSLHVRTMGGGRVNFCHFGACILLNEPFRLVFFILNWIFFVKKIQFYVFGPKIVTDEVN